MGCKYIMNESDLHNNRAYFARPDFNVQKITHYLRFQRAVGDYYSKKISAAAAFCGVSKPEADVLLFLANNPLYDAARDIAKFRGFSKAYVSGAVEQLLEKKLISMSIDREDRRRQHLKLCPEAEQTVETLRTAQCEFTEELGEGITPAELDIFFDVLEKFSENIAGRQG